MHRARTRLSTCPGCLHLFHAEPGDACPRCGRPAMDAGECRPTSPAPGGAPRRAADRAGAPGVRGARHRRGLETCTTCGAAVATSAASCPRCGAPTPAAAARRGTRRGLACALIGWALLGWPAAFAAGAALRLRATPGLADHLGADTLAGAVLARTLAADATLVWAAGVGLIGMAFVALPRK